MVKHGAMTFCLFMSFTSHYHFLCKSDGGDIKIAETTFLRCFDTKLCNSNPKGLPKKKKTE